MSDNPEIGTRVNVLGAGDLSGTVAGYGVATRGLETLTYCLVELDEGFWSANHDVFISMLVVHPESMEVIDES